MRIDEIVTCPYCGDKLKLATLPIVATNVTRGGGSSASDSGGGGLFGGHTLVENVLDLAEVPGTIARAPRSNLFVRPVSGSAVLATIYDWPVGAYPPTPTPDTTHRPSSRKPPP